MLQADLTAAGLANPGLENQANMASVGKCMLFGAKHMAKKIMVCLHPAMATRTVFWHETCCCLQLTTRTSRSLDHCPIWCHVGASDRQQSTASCKITKQQHNEQIVVPQAVTARLVVHSKSVFVAIQPGVSCMGYGIARSLMSNVTPGCGL